MIIYWQLYHFNGVALIQVTEPWNICSEIKNNTEQMEGYTMFLDWKKQYCENDYTTQIIYRFDTIPVKLPMAFFIELEPKVLQF